VNGDDGMVILKIIAINADIMAYSLDNDGRWSTASDSTMKPGHKIFGNVIGVSMSIFAPKIYCKFD